MAKLIVEEAGAQRAFRLGDGVVTIGSGEGARLKLSSADVAEVHAEIELTGGTIRLRPKPGVTPPQRRGRSRLQRARDRLRTDSLRRPRK